MSLSLRLKTGVLPDTGPYPENARTWVEVDTSAIEENTRRLKRFVEPAQVIAVLKGNAYGHGLIECAAAARRGGAASLAVGDVEEARRLRLASDSGEIIVLGPVMPQELPELVALRSQFVISSRNTLTALIAETKRSSHRARVHLAVDTGLGREGFAPEEIGEVWRALKTQWRIEIAGVMSQLKTSRDENAARRQREILLSVASELPAGVMRHLAHSGGITLGRDFLLDGVRPGLALYGLSRSCNRTMRLRPALNWRTRIVERHWRRAGSEVGYAPGEKLTRDSLLGIIPVGYGHGYPRASRGPVLVRGRLTPITGKVNMLTSLIDLTDVPDAAEGEIVTLVGSDGEHEIGAAELYSGPDVIPNLFTCGLTGLVQQALRKE
jgi:alanine racemase